VYEALKFNQVLMFYANSRVLMRTRPFRFKETSIIFL